MGGKVKRETKIVKQGTMKGYREPLTEGRNTGQRRTWEMEGGGTSSS